MENPVYAPVSETICAGDDASVDSATPGAEN